LSSRQRLSAARLSVRNWNSASVRTIGQRRLRSGCCKCIPVYPNQFPQSAHHQIWSSNRSRSQWVGSSRAAGARSARTASSRKGRLEVNGIRPRLPIANMDWKEFVENADWSWNIQGLRYAGSHQQ
jgi:hypothetical protein